jgi:hypothetical protein
MQAQLTKLCSIAALLVTLLFWRSALNYQMELKLVICFTGAIVLIQAFQARTYGWAGGFLAIVLLFNPLIPVFQLTGVVGLSIVILSIGLFATALVVLRPHRLMSMASITGRNPGSQSL